MPFAMAILPRAPSILKPHSPKLPHLLPHVRSHLSNNQSLKSTWSHRALVAGGSSTVLISLAKSAAGAATSRIWLKPILAGFVAYILADLGSGIFHWALDNYGDADTPFLGAQIEAAQGHHKWPWTIARREPSNNLHALARAVTFLMLPFNLFCHDPVFLGFVGVFSGCAMLSQQTHAWAHTAKSRLPAVVLALQDGGVLVSRSRHAPHHRWPHKSGYCVVSGVWNEVLDGSRFFEAVEMVIFLKFRVRPKSWSERDSGWVEEIHATSSES